eukprot:scaffold4650_cov36-Prasinocladus_malaysianus.AAC.2
MPCLSFVILLHPSDISVGSDTCKPEWQDAGSDCKLSIKVQGICHRAGIDRAWKQKGPRVVVGLRAGSPDGLVNVFRHLHCLIHSSTNTAHGWHECAVAPVAGAVPLECGEVLASVVQHGQPGLGKRYRLADAFEREHAQSTDADHAWRGERAVLNL